jgi:large subunit ribosomal protein L23
MKDAYDVILGPIITEKMSLVAERANVVAFKVAPDANKIEIRRAVEQIWKVKVDDVRTASFRGKLKRLGRFAGRRSDWKKAYVTLAEGQAIPEFS